MRGEERRGEERRGGKDTNGRCYGRLLLVRLSYRCPQPCRQAGRRRRRRRGSDRAAELCNWSIACCRPTRMFMQ